MARIDFERKNVMVITQSEKLFRNTIRIMISHAIFQCLHDSGKNILRKEESAEFATEKFSCGILCRDD